MLEFYADNFISHYSRFLSLASKIEELPDGLVPITSKDSIARNFEAFEVQCKSIRLTGAAMSIQILRKKILEVGCKNSEFCTLFHSTKAFIASELESCKLLYLPPEVVDYYNNDDLFTIAVQFPEANKEITLAGNCYATENYTACVFHLMRAVEIAVKAMVKTMNAQKYIGTYKPNKSTNSTKQFVKKPIELCDWKTLIDGLKKALSILEQGSGNSMVKKQKVAFYSHAITQFGYFKDAWRNTISHGHEIVPNRTVYLQGETIDIMNQTKLFLQHLAKRVKE